MHPEDTTDVTLKLCKKDKRTRGCGNKSTKYALRGQTSGPN